MCTNFAYYTIIKQRDVTYKNIKILRNNFSSKDLALNTNIKLDLPCLSGYFSWEEIAPICLLFGDVGYISFRWTYRYTKWPCESHVPSFYIPTVIGDVRVNYFLCQATSLNQKHKTAFKYYLHKSLPLISVRNCQTKTICRLNYGIQWQKNILL